MRDGTSCNRIEQAVKKKQFFVKLGNLKLVASDEYTGNGKSSNNV